ncbi:hypothetical protein [Shewanella atlantica]|uniref:Uncharacterized protein n=1 Tax=Shewanella atlantica TaxID=271099 RepID=A0A3S0KSN1_9GAMM|nr:hypothetical protein [Shewanella atlantica]RTR33516.1 hypothetical protein EKG39_07275 [Shewanella atlantica]
MKNLSFQARQIWWRSRARIWVTWLLSRLGIFVIEAAEKTAQAISFAWYLLPAMFVSFLFVCALRIVWGL